MDKDIDFAMFETVMRHAAALTMHQKGNDWDDFVTAMFEELILYPLDAVKAAVTQHVRHNKFMPVFADIVSAIEGDIDDVSLVMWDSVLRARQKWGDKKAPCLIWPYRGIHYAVEKMGGWSFIPHRGDDDEPFKRKDFIYFLSLYSKQDRYKNVLEKFDALEAPEYIDGGELRSYARGKISAALNGYGCEYEPKVINAVTGELIRIMTPDELFPLIVYDRAFGSAENELLSAYNSLSEDEQFKFLFSADFMPGEKFLVDRTGLSPGQYNENAMYYARQQFIRDRLSELSGGDRLG